MQLDLHNLTPERVAEAMSHLGMPKYAAPCIIGVLVPEEEREELDQFTLTGVELLIKNNLISFPDNQLEDVVALQEAFDWSRADDVLRILERYQA